MSPVKWNIPIIAVEKDYRQRNVGTALMLSMLEAIGLCGGTYVTTDTNRDHLNGGSMRFLESCGFVPDGEPQEGYWGGYPGVYVQRYVKHLLTLTYLSHM